MKLSILIATVPKNQRYLEKCLEALRKYTTNVDDLEVLIYFNGQPKEMLLNMINHNKGITYTCSNENLGVAKPINELAKIATNPFLMHLNDDMVVLPNWDVELEKTYKQRLKDYKHFYLTPRVIEPNVPFHTKHCVNGDYGDTVETFKEIKLISEYKRFNSVDLYAQTMPWILKKETFEKVGGYSEEFPTYCSDSDLYIKIYKLVNDSKYFVCCGRSLVYHFGSKTTSIL